MLSFLDCIHDISIRYRIYISCIHSVIYFFHSNTSILRFKTIVILWSICLLYFNSCFSSDAKLLSSIFIEEHQDLVTTFFLLEKGSAQWWLAAGTLVIQRFLLLQVLQGSLGLGFKQETLVSALEESKFQSFTLIFYWVQQENIHFQRALDANTFGVGCSG